MKRIYTEYIEEFPEELANVRAVIRRSVEIEKARGERVKAKLALIQKCREELENEARYKRS